MPHARAPAPHAAAGVRELFNLPADWERRVRALPSASVPHLPSGARDGLAVATAEALEALLAAEDDQLLELGRTKLLLAPPPHGLPLRTELAERLRLWRTME